MSNLNKLDFTTLEASRRNYLKWVQDVKLHLIAKKLWVAIKSDNETKKSDKTAAMICIRRYMSDALQMEYLAEEDLWALWVALEEHFDHQKMIYLPNARHDCQKLCYQDFKSLN